MVADAITLAPQPRTRASNSGDGRPKWKLTTRGANDSTTSATSALNGARPGLEGIASASMPNSANQGASAARHAVSRAASGTGGAWQKKLTFHGFVVCVRIASSSVRSASSESVAAGSEPSPPSLLTAIAIGLVCTPAIGAWMIGSSMLNKDWMMVIGRSGSRVDARYSEALGPPSGKSRFINAHTRIQSCTWMR